MEKRFSVTLKQGKYLQECTNKLLTLLQECSEIEASNQNENKSGSQSEYAKEKEKKRNLLFCKEPKLIREAKRTHVTNAACGFEFKDKYGDWKRLH